MPYCKMSDGTQIYYEDFGEGPPILFTPNGLATSKMWAEQIFGLYDRFRCITFDWRGLGKSDRPSSGYTASTVVSDIIDLVEALDLGPVTLAGHGIGATATLWAATTRPDLVSKMVLISAGPWVEGDKDGVGGISLEFVDYMKTLFQPSHSRGMPRMEGMAAFGENWLFHREPSPATIHYVYEDILACPQYVVEPYIKDFHQYDNRERLPMITWPTLLIHGKHDLKQRYEGALYLHERIKDSVLVTLEESGHMCFIEEFPKMNAAIADFVDTGTIG